MNGLEMNRWIGGIGLALAVCAAAGFQEAEPRPGSRPAVVDPNDSPGRRVYRQVEELLRQKRLDDAFKLAQEGLVRYPDDDYAKLCYLELHVETARKMIDRESYTEAERLLRAALMVAPNDSITRELLERITSARAKAGANVREAQQWLQLELFEPAAVTFRQVRALFPDQAKEWAQWYLAALIGVGDDYYFTKDFRQAFIHYDAAAQLVRSGEAPRERLMEFAAAGMQSLVLSLGAIPGRPRYGDPHWRTIRGVFRDLADAGAGAMSGVGGGVDSIRQVTGRVLDGLDRERAGDDEGAVRAYRQVAPGLPGGGDVSQAREAALQAVRATYSPQLTQRRAGIWARYEEGDWQTLETPRFRIHHRNVAGAQRISQALDHHFARIARYFGRPPESVTWKAPCEIYLYRDSDAFRGATGRTDIVSGMSIVRSRGRELESHAIHVFQTDPMLMSATIPHELTHLILAAVVEYRVPPAVLREGIALHCEPDCRTAQFARLLPRRDRRRGLTELLAQEEVHPAGQPAFYAEAFGLVDVLVKRMNMADLVSACTADDAIAALPGAMLVGDLAELDALWRKVPTTQPVASP